MLSYADAWHSCVFYNYSIRPFHTYIIHFPPLVRENEPAYTLELFTSQVVIKELTRPTSRAEK